jgi:hypothetical protein
MTLVVLQEGQYRVQIPEIRPWLRRLKHAGAEASMLCLIDAESGHTIVEYLFHKTSVALTVEKRCPSGPDSNETDQVIALHMANVGGNQPGQLRRLTDRPVLLHGGGASWADQATLVPEAGKEENGPRLGVRVKASESRPFAPPDRTC